MFGLNLDIFLNCYPLSIVCLHLESILHVMWGLLRLVLVAGEYLGGVIAV